MSSKDALVRDLKARLETLTAKESAHSSAVASDLAREKAKSKDSWKADRDREGDGKDDKDRASKQSIPSFGGGPSRSSTPSRLPPPPPPPPPPSSGMTGNSSSSSSSSSTGSIRVAGSKDSPKGVDSDAAESEILSATAHLSASELRNR